MLIIANSCREPMHDSELAIEMRHNLKPNLKLDLLHVLSKLCVRRVTATKNFIVALVRSQFNALM